MWIYIPTYHCTQEQGDLTLDLEQITQELSHSYTWREILKPQQFWLKKYEQVDWIKHLFGAIPPPLTANRLLEEWIQSLGVSPVNHSHLQEEGKEQKTNDGYGKTSRDWLARYDQESCSWKMSQDCLWGEYKLSQENFPRWGMMQNGLLYKLKKSEHHIKEKEYSYWQDQEQNDLTLWQTPTTARYLHRSDKTVLLDGQILMWKTPLARDWKGKSFGNSLPDQVEDQWNFPQHLTIKDGKKLSKKDLISHQKSRINPKFVEWLMGWEENWLDVQS